MVCDIFPEFINAYEWITVPSTTFDTRNSATDVDVTSGTSFGANTDVAIYAGDRYDIVRVTVVSTNNFTLQAPGLIYTSHDSDSTVTPLSFTVTDSRLISNVSWVVNTTSELEWKHLEPTSMEDMYRIGELVSGTGDPSHYAFPSTTEMRVYPIPDSAGYLKIRYKNKSEYTLADDSAEPSFDEGAHVGLIYWCLWHAFAREGDMQSANVYRQWYYLLVDRTKALMAKKKQNETSLHLQRADYEED